MINPLRTLLDAAAHLRVPDLWSASLPAIRDQRHIVDRLLRSSPSKKIYGFNTMSGHREGDTLSDRQMSQINGEILTSHCIGDDVYFEPFAARCIGVARLCALAAGGSGISEDLYSKIIGAVTSPAFQPHIPSRVSYSSGDVIAGAHWVRDLLSYLGVTADDLRPGEVMALINGCSVQVGAAAALIPALEDLWGAFGESSEMLYACGGIRRDSLYAFHSGRPAVAEALRTLSKRLEARHIADASALQESVSIRAFPQFLEVLHVAIADYIGELNVLISNPSCNPLFQEAEPHYVSQASFLAPLLTTRISSLIDAILFILSGVVGRLTFLLGGSVPGIRIDGAEAHDLGIIQVPKLMAAELDALRLACGTRWSISHISTSYGLEDVASYGLIEIERLRKVITGALEIVRSEIAAVTLVSRHPGHSLGRSAGEESMAQHFVALRRDLRTVEFATRGSWSRPFFPGSLGDWRRGA